MWPPLSYLFASTRTSNRRTSKPGKRRAPLLIHVDDEDDEDDDQFIFYYSGWSHREAHADHFRV